MATKRKSESGTVAVRILVDGVFVADGVRKDEGETAELPAEIATILIERGHAARI